MIRRDVIAKGEVDERSITEIKPEALRNFTQHHFFAGIGVWSYALRLAGWPDDRPVWTGSCPCPSFSAAGKGGGFDDPRHLWPHWARLVRECQPATIFGEQADDAIGYGWLDLVQTDLEREKYAVGKAVLGACSVGAPHIRQRLYFVAHTLRSERGKVNEHGIDGCDRANGGRTEAHSITGTRGEVFELADTAESRHTDAWEHGSGPSPLSARSAKCGGNGQLGNTATDRPEMRRHLYGEHDRQGFSEGRHADKLADADRRGQSMHRATQGQPGQSERSVEGDRMGEPIREGLEGYGRDGENGHESRWFGAQPDRSVTAPSFVNGFWRDADWILRRKGNGDGAEWCPTEPGTFPLAAGVTKRVLKLRGYGDAICAPLAAEFIKTVMEAT